MVSFISDINNKVDVFLKQKAIASRHKASSGVIISVLLPLCILKGEFRSYFIDYNIKLWIPLSFGLLLHSILNIFYLRRNVPIYNGLSLIPSIILTFILTYSSFDTGCTWKVILNCSLIFLYEYGVLYIMKLCPKAFTYGESCCVTQSIVLFLVSCFTRSSSFTCIDNATVILKVGLLCVVGISLLSFTLNVSRNVILFVGIVVSTICLLLLPVLYNMLGINPFIWIYHLITSDSHTIILFSFWVLCSLMGVGAVVYQVHIEEKADTIVRKSFHILSLLVYLPGIMINSCLLYLASGVVFALFIMADVIRVLNIPYLSIGLNKGFNVFSDEKDMGGLSLTPLYLVAGCSLPLWLHPNPSPNNLLPLLSGLLTVAIGDTAASVCGSLFGKNKWAGTNKTKEGTIACFISQLFFIIALIHFGFLPRKDLIRPFVALSIASFVEARTSQVDNLVLPMLMYIIVV